MYDSLNAAKSLLMVLTCAFVLACEAAAMSDAELVKRANFGDVSCMRKVAKKLYTGDGVRRDVHTAIAWLKKAVDRRDPIACIMLGDIYRQGSGSIQNPDKAYKYYCMAKAYGSNKADERIALLPPKYQNNFGGGFGSDDAAYGYPTGWKKTAKVGIPRPNESDEVRALREKAEQGDAMAQYELGMIYNEGKGVPQNRQEALKWLRRAKDGGSPYAENYMKEME